MRRETIFTALGLILPGLVSTSSPQVSQKMQCLSAPRPCQYFVTLAHSFLSQLFGATICVLSSAWFLSGLHMSELLKLPGNVLFCKSPVIVLHWFFSGFAGWQISLYHCAPTQYILLPTLQIIPLADLVFLDLYGT